MFKSLRARAEARRHQQAFDAAQEAHRSWADELAKATQGLDSARTFEGFEPAEADAPLVTKKGERIFAIVESAALVEPRRLPGRWEGGHQGVSIRVAKGVYWRTGGTRGTYRQGEEQQKLIDEGTAVITNQRMVFLGPKYNREWAFTKILGVQHDDDLGASYLQVSNRQRVSGIAYGQSAAGDVQFRIDLAVANFNGTRDQLVSDLEAFVSDLKSREPALPPPPAPPDG